MFDLSVPCRMSVPMFAGLMVLHNIVWRPTNRSEVPGHKEDALSSLALNPEDGLFR